VARPFLAKPDCIPCALRQVLSTTRRVSDDPWFHAKVLKKVMADLSECDMARSAAEVSFEALRSAAAYMGTADPYAEEKRKHNAVVKGILPDLRRRIGESTDPLGLAARLAIAGNMIDLGVLSEVDVFGAIDRAVSEPLAIDDLPALREGARAARSVLYVLDNAGEIALDGLFIEQLKRKEVTCLVRAAPVLNDATREDAEEAGLGGFCAILDPGTPMLGLVLGLASAEVAERFEKADLVIAKGQANFETLCGSDREIFFLLNAKCKIVADELGVPLGAAVLLQREPAHPPTAAGKKLPAQPPAP